MTKRQHGVIVTHIDHLDQLDDCLRRGAYDTIKIVTGWGMDGGWEPHMRELLHMAPNVIVRTVTGDPSFDNHNHDFQFPDDKRVKDELTPWYEIRKDIMFEIGNEPNIDDHPSQDFMFDYCFFLRKAIEVCRSQFRDAKLISPGLIIGPHKEFERFNQIATDTQTFQRCDFIGLHVYEHFGFAKKDQPTTTNQLRDAIRVAQQFYSDKLWYVTEYGINDTTQIAMGEKGRRYAGMAYYDASDPVLPDNVVGLTYYHLNMRRDNDPQYHIFPDGDVVFGNRVRAQPPRDIAPLTMGTPLRFVIINPCNADPAKNFANVRQAPNPHAKEAGQLLPGTPVLVDVIADGWAHLARANPFLDLGFVDVSLLRQEP
jgi:hypothetical protein